MSMLNKTKNKIRGALYGFAIGDAMGATTEFLTSEQIKVLYGEINDIVGGGWLNLKVGEVTDDTQMMVCVIDALMKYPNDIHDFKNECVYNFIDWYKSCPKDVGGQCSLGIKHYMKTHNYIYVDNDALGNGSLMRALPCALLGLSNFNVEQGVITHNNKECSLAILEYTRLIKNIIYNDLYISNEYSLEQPSGFIWNTFGNALFWANSKTFEEAIIGAVNHGGDADTIAAITGSIAGARHGYDNIPEKWINKLDKNVVNKLETFLNFICTLS